MNEILSQTTNKGISNSLTCLTAVTLFVVVEPKLLFSTKKELLVNVTQAVAAVSVIVFEVLLATTQLCVLFIVVIKSARVESLLPLKTTGQMFVQLIFIDRLSQIIRVLARFMLSTCATAATFATWLILGITEYIFNTQEVNGIQASAAVIVNVSFQSKIESTSDRLLI